MDNKKLNFSLIRSTEKVLKARFCSPWVPFKVRIPAEVGPESNSHGLTFFSIPCHKSGTVSIEWRLAFRSTRRFFATYAVLCQMTWS